MHNYTIKILYKFRVFTKCILPALTQLFYTTENALDHHITHMHTADSHARVWIAYWMHLMYLLLMGIHTTDKNVLAQVINSHTWQILQLSSDAIYSEMRKPMLHTYMHIIIWHLEMRTRWPSIVLCYILSLFWAPLEQHCGSVLITGVRFITTHHILGQILV